MEHVWAGKSDERDLAVVLELYGVFNPRHSSSRKVPCPRKGRQKFGGLDVLRVFQLLVVTIVTVILEVVYRTNLVRATRHSDCEIPGII